MIILYISYTNISPNYKSHEFSHGKRGDDNTLLIIMLPK